MHEAYMSKYSLSLFREEEKPIFSGKSLRIREAYLIGKEMMIIADKIELRLWFTLKCRDRD